MSEEKQEHRDPERTKLIGPDKLIMQTIADYCDRWATDMDKNDPVFCTTEAALAFVDLISRIKSAADCFEKEGNGLK